MVKFLSKNFILLGFLISDKLINQDLVEKQRNKYIPPEAFLYMAEDLSFDIWSFGCILIDIFSKEHPIFKLILTNEELSKLYDAKKFPYIPDDINSLLKEIVCKCLDYDYMNRITIYELSENLNILFEDLLNNTQNLCK